LKHSRSRIPGVPDRTTCRLPIGGRGETQYGEKERNGKKKKAKVK